MFKHILCPIDGSEPSTQALDLASRLAADQHATLTILTVVDPAKAAAMAYGDPGMSAACLDALDGEGKSLVENAAERVRGDITAQTACVDGQSVSSIIDYAKTQSCDLIVIGSHGRGGLPRALLGSVAEGVLRHASVPVLTVRWTKASTVSHS